MRSGAYVMRPYMPLQIAGIGKNLQQKTVPSVKKETVMRGLRTLSTCTISDEKVVSCCFYRGFKEDH